MDDWIKFEGNPLLAEYGWRHHTDQTLVLPESPPGQPQDQSIVRGVGPWKGRWMLLFNISSYASSGLGPAMARPRGRSRARALDALRAGL